MWSVFNTLYLVRPTQWLMQLLSNYLWWVYHVFGVGRHARQLFVPWHRLVSVKTKPGFSISEWFERVSYNLISSVIGAIVRLHVIVAGLVLMVLAILLWLMLVGVLLISLVTLPLVYAYFVWRYSNWQKKLTQLDGRPGMAAQFLQRSQIFKTALIRLALNSTQAQALLDQAAPEWTVPQSIRDQWRSRLPNQEFEFSVVEEFFASQSALNWLQQQKISQQDLDQLLGWMKGEHYREQHARRFWLRANLQKTRAIGKSWTYGYTPQLDQWVSDLALDIPPELVSTGREELLEQLELIFSKKGRTNLLLVGQDGVGKMSICRLFAKHIADGLTTPQLADHRVVSLDMTALLAREQKLSAQLQALKSVVAEASAAGNIILVIPDFDQYLDPNTEVPDVSQIFKEIEKDARIKVIGLMNQAGYERSVSVNPVIDSAFEVVRMEPMSKDETLTVLLRDLQYIEREHDLFIEYPALKTLVEQSARILPKQNFPQKAFNILDEVIVAAQSKAERRISAEFVNNLLSRKSGVQLGSVSVGEALSLQQIEQKLTERVVGQKAALQAVAAGLQRSRLGLRGDGKPVTTLLFLGPTGVGKTETAKAVAEIAYGSADVLQRFDCSQYVASDSVTTLIGAPAQQGRAASSGLLTSAIANQPQGVVLFDELEKAHPAVHNLLLTLLDEGYLVDGLGARVSFQHSIVLATSNAASQLIESLFAQTSDLHPDTMEAIRTEVIQGLIEERIFTPEFLNRFDEIVLFAPLTYQELLKIAQMKVAQLAQSLQQEHSIVLEVTDGVLQQLVESAYDPRFGARELERVLRRKIVDRISQRLLANDVAAGQTLVIDAL